MSLKIIGYSGFDSEDYENVSKMLAIIMNG
jgi:hypothetical protein